MKRYIILGLVFIGIFFLSSLVFAENKVITTSPNETETTSSPNIIYVPEPVPPLKFRVGMKAGLSRFYPLDSQLSGYYKTQLLIGGTIGAKANNGLEIQLDTDYQMSNNSSFSTIKLEVVPVLLTLRYHPLRNSQISPYFGGGLGLYYIREQSDSYDYMKSFQLGKTILGGVDMRFSQNTYLRIEARKDYVGSVSNNLYYRCNFGGLKATIGVIFEVPIKKNSSQANSNNSDEASNTTSSYEDKIDQLNDKISSLEYQISKLEDAHNKHYWGWGWKYSDEDDLLWEIRRLRYKLKNHKNNLSYIKYKKEQQDHDDYLKEKAIKKEEAMKQKKSTNESEYKSTKDVKKESKDEKSEKNKTKVEEEQEKYLKERLKKKEEAKNKQK